MRIITIKSFLLGIVLEHVYILSGTLAAFLVSAAASALVQGLQCTPVEYLDFTYVVDSELNCDLLLDKVNVVDDTHSAGSPDLLTGLRKSLVSVCICFLLELKAAHESSACAVKLGGVKGQALISCHTESNGSEVVQECTAAKLSAADTDTAYKLSLVS